MTISSTSCSTLQGYDKAFSEQTADERIENGKYKTYKGRAHKQVVANWEHTATPVLPFYLLDYLLAYVGDFVMLPLANRKNKQNPLHRAAVANDLEEIKRLVAVEHVDVNSIGKSCHTPLMAAIMADNFESSRLLIDLGADPYKKITCLRGEEEITVSAYDYVTDGTGGNKDSVSRLLHDIALRDNRLDEFEK